MTAGKRVLIKASDEKSYLALLQLDCLTHRSRDTFSLGHI